MELCTGLPLDFLLLFYINSYHHLYSYHAAIATMIIMVMIMLFLLKLDLEL